MKKGNKKKAVFLYSFLYPSLVHANSYNAYVLLNKKLQCLCLDITCRWLLFFWFIHYSLSPTWAKQHLYQKTIMTLISVHPYQVTNLVLLT